MTGTASEQAYLDLLGHVLDHGSERLDRTGVGTRSVFGAMLRFDVGKATPILSTKRVYWKTAVKEMLWFLTGQTDLASLLRENVRIWTDWPLARYRRETGEAMSQEAFEARILGDEDFAARWGELGPIYGKQWRRWLGPDGREHDQIAALVHTLKTDPASRRMLFHGWNVGELAEMALPPCHLLYQFHVTDNRLSLMLTQRSVDLVLGCPFNWVGAVALQTMLAQQCDMELGDFVWVGGDIHVYANQIEAARLQLSRAPRPFPRLRLIRRPDSIDGYRIEDFELDGYDPHPAIAVDVAV